MNMRNEVMRLSLGRRREGQYNVFDHPFSSSVSHLFRLKNNYDQLCILIHTTQQFRFVIDIKHFEKESVCACVLPRLCLLFFACSWMCFFVKQPKKTQ